MERVLEKANSIKGWLQFTGVTVGPRSGDLVPMLDTSLRVDHIKEGETVVYRFYEKPCAFNMVIMAQSAMPSRVKFQTLSNEVIRRLWNSDRLTTSNSMRAQLMQKMANSSYLASLRSQVTSGLHGNGPELEVWAKLDQ